MSLGSCGKGNTVYRKIFKPFPLWLGSVETKSQYRANISRVYWLKRGFFVGKIVIKAAQNGGV